MNSLLNELAGVLLSQSLQIGIVFLIVMMACILLRRASAHWRYLLWLLVIAKCLTPPIVSFSLPVLPSQQIADARSSDPDQNGILPTFVVLTRNSAAVDDRNSQNNSVELKKFKCRFLDEGGRPVQGVLVTAAGLRCEEEPSSYYGWPTEFAPKTEYATDANGEVQVEYPTNFGFLANRQGLTSTKLFFRCKHEQYISLENIEVGVSVENFTRTLERGCQVTLTCQAPDGLPIKEFANVTPGCDREIWKLQDGKMHSGSLPVGSTQTMLVVPSADGKHLFSEPVDLLCSKEEVLTSEIEVQPGMILSGRLADNVPRPIEQGKVIAFCVPKPLGPSFTANPAVSWTDEAIISADGSFKFASLPPSKSVQLIALCRGWLTDQWGVHMLAQGQVLDIDQDRIASKKITGIALTMEQAGAIEVVVLVSNSIQDLRHLMK